MSREYTVFYYWDNVDDTPIPDYLLLCLETWKKHAKAQDIVRIGLDNIENISNGDLTAKQMRLFSPAQRSDAATAVTMYRYAGLFIDADTILLPSFNPYKYLSNDKPSMFAYVNGDKHLISNAFLASPHPHSYFMKIWTDKVIEKIAREEKSISRQIRRNIRTFIGKRNHVKWDYLGTSILDDLLSKNKDLCALNFMNPSKSGYLPVVENYTADSINAYWLNPIQASEIQPSNFPDGIIALQNSWLPDQFKKMNKEEILNHPSRLGKLLAYSLHGRIGV